MKREGYINTDLLGRLGRLSTSPCLPATHHYPVSSPDPLSSPPPSPLDAGHSWRMHPVSHLEPRPIANMLNMARRVSSTLSDFFLLVSPVAPLERVALVLAPTNVSLSFESSSQ